MNRFSQALALAGLSLPAALPASSQAEPEESAAVWACRYSCRTLAADFLVFFWKAFDSLACASASSSPAVGTTDGAVAGGGLATGDASRPSPLGRLSTSLSAAAPAAPGLPPPRSPPRPPPSPQPPPQSRDRAPLPGPWPHLRTRPPGTPPPHKLQPPPTSPQRPLHQSRRGHVNGDRNVSPCSSVAYLSRNGVMCGLTCGCC